MTHICVTCPQLVNERDPINSVWPSDANIDLVNFASGNGLLPDVTNVLVRFVVFTWVAKLLFCIMSLKIILSKFLPEGIRSQWIKVTR